jgi:dTMP kinase
MFLVIEGIDGAGVGTQAEILREKLMTKDHILFLRYPDYNNPVGTMIHEFLHDRIVLSKRVVFLLYALDQLKDREKINDALAKGKTVLADRYFTSDLAYQCGNDLSVNDAVKFAKIFDIPKPDLVIFLDVKPEIAMTRKKKEKEKLDIHERDVGLLKEIRENYDELISKRIFAKKWVVIDGNKSIEEVAKAVEKAISNLR